MRDIPLTARVVRSREREPGCSVPLDGLAVLTILFVVLKVYRLIDWSWWLVLAPLWLPFAVVILGIVAFMVLWVAVQMLAR